MPLTVNVLSLQFIERKLFVTDVFYQLPTPIQCWSVPSSVPGEHWTWHLNERGAPCMLVAGVCYKDVHGFYFSCLCFELKAKLIICETSFF